MRLQALVLVSSAALGLGCMAVGSRFPSGPVSRLEVGRTTEAQVAEMFGPPWRTGMENGQRTWSYADYFYTITGPTRARDLFLKFDKNGVLTSYTYNTTEPGR